MNIQWILLMKSSFIVENVYFMAETITEIEFQIDYQYFVWVICYIRFDCEKPHATHKMDYMLLLILLTAFFWRDILLMIIINENNAKLLTGTIF